VGFCGWGFLWAKLKKNTKEDSKGKEKGKEDVSGGKIKTVSFHRLGSPDEAIGGEGTGKG